jgi:CheY-like chemotaxis protein
LQNLNSTNETNPSILVVDDEPDLRELICSEILELGFSVLQAGDGLEALEIYKQKQDSIGLVLCDISMPKMNGLDFFKHASTVTGFAPFVMLTAHADSEFTTEAVRLGAIDYLVKPFDFVKFEKQIYVWLEIAHRRAINQGDSRMSALLKVKSSNLNKAG